VDKPGENQSDGWENNMKLKSKKGAPGGSRHGAERRHDRGGNFHTDEGHITGGLLRDLRAAVPTC